MQERELPDGWRRVQVREGFVGRELEYPLAGFTTDLPAGWSAGESWPSSQGPSGWIAGVPPGDDQDVPTLSFHVGAGFSHSLDAMEKDPRSDIRRITVDGAPAILYLAAPDAIDKGPQVGIFYERIPGGPPGTTIPSLRIDGDSRGFTDQELLARVLTSVRYAAIPELPGVPAPGIPPGADWSRVAARSDYATFTLKLPPGWRTTDLRGIDTLVGRISGDGITLTYDFGSFAGPMYGPVSEIRERTNEQHLIWEERIGDGLFWFVKPASAEPAQHAVTGVFANFESGPSADRMSPITTPRLSLFAKGLAGSQQEIVLAIFRTIEIERR